MNAMAIGVLELLDAALSSTSIATASTSARSSASFTTGSDGPARAVAAMRRRPPAERPPVFSTRPDSVKARSSTRRRCIVRGPSTTSDFRDPFDESPRSIKAKLSGKGNRKVKARIVKGSGSKPV
jgi:hypothetical protein